MKKALFDREPKPPPQLKPIEWLILLPIIAVVLSNFLLNLRGELPTWGDETFTLRLVSENWSEFFREIVSDVHPPLYFLLCKIFAGIPDLSGFNGAYHPRFFSYLLFIFLFYLTVSTPERWHEPGIKGGFKYRAILGLLILGSAFFALFGPMMRYYALSAIFVVSATNALFFAINQNGGKKSFTAYAVYIWLAFSTSYLTAIVIPAHMLYVLRSPQADKRKFTRALIGLSIASIPLIWLMAVQLRGINGGNWHGIRSFILHAIASGAFSIYSFTLGEFILPWKLAITLPAFAAFTFLLIYSFRRINSPYGKLIWLTFWVSLPIGAVALA
ncbi:MAG: hypothetical protein ABIC40_07905, partial [bacterium]